jgi:hypothetical protein
MFWKFKFILAKIYPMLAFLKPGFQLEKKEDKSIQFIICSLAVV